MSWLDNWAKRIKLTIDQTNIDDDLINFPVLVTLMSGTNTASVFDELSTVSGTKKIAITTTVSGVETELYTEIERWDWTNEKANLWVKIPTVSSGTNTELYLYYDSDHADNTTHVGDTGDSAAQNVWDSNFVGVWHMAQDPNGDVADAIKDSTSNTNHGTPVGSMTTGDLVDGKIGKGIDLDGDNDGITCGHAGDVGNGDYTIEAVAKKTVAPISGDGTKIIIGKRDVAAVYPFELEVSPYSDGGYYRIGAWDGSAAYLATTDVVALTEVTYLITGTYDGSDIKCYVNEILKDTVDVIGHVDWSNADDYTIGFREKTGSNLYIDGIIDEVRISNTARSAAWIKATYYSNWDELVAYGIEQIIHYYYDGYVTENNNPVSRKVSLYNRDTGVFADTTTSNDSTGYYYLTTTVSGEHFIVTFDDDAGEDYNALVLDKLLPRGIE